MNDTLPVSAPLSPGRVLAAARADLKLSVADVSQQIKYGVKQIAAIEADDYDKLPGTTFVRGMIRGYAKLVQIDPAPLLAQLGRCETPPAVAVDLRTSEEPFVEGGGKSNRIYVLLSLAALAVAAVAYQWQIDPLDTGEVVTITPKATQGDLGDTAPAPAVAPPTPTPAPATAPDAPVAGAPVAARPRVQEATPAGAASGNGLMRIELEFDQLSWARIRQADGKILLSQLNPAGSKQLIEGVAPFEVVIGNAAKVRLIYNDALIDLRPYVKVDVARLKLE